MDDMLDQITMDSLYGKHKELAELIGLDSFIKLIRKYGGQGELYIPKLRDIVQDLRNEQIRNKYNGYNCKAIAEEYGLTVRQIYTITSEIRNERQSAAADAERNV